MCLDAWLMRSRSHAVSLFFSFLFSSLLTCDILKLIIFTIINFWCAFSIILQRLENDLKCQSEGSRDFTETTFSTLKLRSDQQLLQRKQPPKKLQL